MSNQGGGLQIPQGLGAAKTKLVELRDMFTTTNEVEQYLRQLGVHDQAQPTFELPVVTVEALTTTNSNEYTSLYARQLAWYNYLTPLLANVAVRLLQAKNILDVVEAEIKEGINVENKQLPKNEKMTVSEVNTKVTIHPSYQEALLEVQKMTQYKARIGAMAEVAERNMTVISRQVEIRRQEIEGNQREGSMTYGAKHLRPIRRT